MMKNSFLRSHLLTVIAGILFGLLCALLAEGGLPPCVLLAAPLVGALYYAIPTMLGIFFLRWLARKLGPYVGFIVLTCVLALAISFGLAYEHSVTTWLSSRGVIHGTIIGGGAPPEDIGGQLATFASLAVWIALMAMAGVKWKDSREPLSPPPTLARGETAKMCFWLTLDSVFIAVITFALLSTLLIERREWSKPESVFARAVAVLNDKGASPGDRALALDTIEKFRNQDGAIEILRRAVREETGATRLYAAASLIGHDDLAALPVLEDSLMGRTQVTGTILPTTSHTPSEGNGVHTAGFGHLGTTNFGYCLNGVKDPAAAPILVHLMTSPVAETRRGAASALRNMMTLKERGWDRWVSAWPSTIDVAPIADAMITGLDDSDEMVRYFSVCTLMEINGNPHYPAVFLFKGNEVDYVEGWKAWVKNRVPPP
jgi:hypothetical protein